MKRKKGAASSNRAVANKGGFRICQLEQDSLKSPQNGVFCSPGSFCRLIQL
jgi:hypothetical protein